MSEEEKSSYVPFPGVQLGVYGDIDPVTYDFAKCATRADRAGPYVKDDVIAAILRTYGNYAAMASLLGRTRSRVRDWVLAHPDVFQIREDVRESALDMVEDGVFTGALMGDSTNSRYLLSTLGKERGYSTRVESTGKGGSPIAIHFDSDDESL